jgi:hypothetical protein
MFLAFGKPRSTVVVSERCSSGDCRIDRDRVVFPELSKQAFSRSAVALVRWVAEPKSG